MRFLAIIKAFETVTSEKDLKRLKQIALDKAQELSKSGKLIESGNFADGRAGFFLLDADSATELWELLFPVHELMHIETHPIQSWEELGEGVKKKLAPM